MKRSVTTILALAGLAACFDDPTSSLRAGPARLQLSASQIFVAPQESIVVSGAVLDAQGNTLPGVVSFSSGDASVATAGDLPALAMPGDMQSSGFVKGVAVGGGAVYVHATSGAITDSIWVIVVPPVFPGAITPSPATVGATITASSTSLVTFDPANVSVTIDGGFPVFMVSASASQVQFIAPVGSSVNISGLLLLGNIDAGTLSAPLSITDPNEPANDAPATAPAITLPAAVGDSVVAYGSIDGTDVDDFFAITTTTGDSLEISVEWPDDVVDNDMYVLNSAGGGFCVLDGCAAAGSSDPEVAKVRLAAATSYRIYINFFDDNGELVPVPYRVKIIKRA